ncbi:MAG: AbrB/MazE/SpoVT family DNA-binding domain-containing protein [Candidatus Brockarchaeota archaeon]|nr:AbrB/MazE/SpoVT family DNA-binding domain-containing protein [Candidatus Brockarchaeota archaeon]
MVKSYEIIPTIPKKVRESLGIGGKILVINAGDHLKIIPLPSDPFKTLHGAFNTKKSFKDLRRQLSSWLKRKQGEDD